MSNIDIYILKRVTNYSGFEFCYLSEKNFITNLHTLKLVNVAIFFNWKTKRIDQISCITVTAIYNNLTTTIAT
jgi:hypothetical protein